MSTSTETPTSASIFASASGETWNLPTASFFEDLLRIRTVLVPLDLSDESYRALEFAIPLARRFGASVHVVHAYQGVPHLPWIARTPVSWSDEETAHRLAFQVQCRSGACLGTEHCHVRLGKADEEILAIAREVEADLIVLSSCGHVGFRPLTLGSTAEKTIRRSPCPVLVVRESTRGPVKATREGIVLEKILVPIDFSECAQDAARYAAAFASKVGADLLLMNVAPPAAFTASDPSIVPPEWCELVETARRGAEDELDELAKILPLTGVSADIEVVVGMPVETLIERTQQSDIDMLITSTHGYTGLPHVLLGSTAEQLIRGAHCPVLVLPSFRRPSF